VAWIVATELQRFKRLAFGIRKAPPVGVGSGWRSSTGTPKQTAAGLNIGHSLAADDVSRRARFVV